MNKFTFSATRSALFFTFFVVIIIGSRNVSGSEFGENETYLGQVVDSYFNDDLVNKSNKVVYNSSLYCMELNGSAYNIVIYNGTQLREHDYWDTYIVEVNFSIVNNDELRESETVDSRLGKGHMFLTVNRIWLEDKYIRFRWYPYYSYVPRSIHRLLVYDGNYDRSNNTDFPIGADIPTKGNGLLYSYSSDEWNSWIIKDFLMDIDEGTEDNVTIFFTFTDSWVVDHIGIYVDWIEFNQDANGVNNIFTINYNNSTPLTMELTGTEGDYGYCDTTEYRYLNGYYYTNEMLNGDRSLNLLYNVSIPSNTDIKLAFSHDNVTWVNHNNVSGYDSLVNGFESLDLRYLNTSSLYMRLNMTTTDSQITPRVYQLRLVTITSVEDDTGALFIIGFVISMIIFIGVGSKLR